jgi:hypothetical protein
MTRTARFGRRSSYLALVLTVFAGAVRSTACGGAIAPSDAVPVDASLPDRGSPSMPVGQPDARATPDARPTPDSGGSVDSGVPDADGGPDAGPWGCLSPVGAPGTAVPVYRSANSINSIAADPTGLYVASGPSVFRCDTKTGLAKPSGPLFTLPGPPFTGAAGIALVGTELFVAPLGQAQTTMIWRMSTSMDGSGPSATQGWVGKTLRISPWGSKLAINRAGGLNATLSMLSTETGAFTYIGYESDFLVRNPQEAYTTSTRWNWEGTTLTSTKAALEVSRILLALPNHLFVLTLGYPERTYALCTYSSVPCESMTPVVYNGPSNYSSLHVAHGFVYAFFDGNPGTYQLSRCPIDNFEQGTCSWPSLATLPGERPTQVEHDEEHLYFLVKPSAQVQTVFRIAK